MVNVSFEIILSVSAIFPDFPYMCLICFHLNANFFVILVANNFVTRDPFLVQIQQHLRRSLPRPHESWDDKVYSKFGPLKTIFWGFVVMYYYRCPGRNGEGGGPFPITQWVANICAAVDCNVTHHDLKSTSTYPEEFESKKLILNYEKTEYLARGGCPAKNPIAKR